jgi:tRNA dimethylallyltransferase
MTTSKNPTADHRPPSNIHIIAGPTASGKSAKAIELAQGTHGVIINCDSLQIYQDLPILSAQPSAADRAAAEHALYGILEPEEACSAGAWCDLAKPLIENLLAQGKTPIICGGTGLYIKALMEGLSPMPEVPGEIRARANALLAEIGSAALHKDLGARDPEMADRFHPNHAARIVRAWEVLEATGKSLAEWQRLDKTAPPAHWHFEIHKILPERDVLRDRCSQRFDRMMEGGVLDEVAAFDARIQSSEIAPDAPVTKALGFKPLQAYLHGKMTREAAIERSKIDTHQYAKRQNTWLRNQL